MPVLSEFAPPWFEGSPTASATEVPATWQVAIAGHGYMIEPSLYRRTLVPVQRDAQDDTGEPGEATLNPAALWRRSQSDWSLGAGQEWLDEDESTRRRFRASLGVDVFTERQFTLLPQTEEKRSSANTNLRLKVAGSRVYAVDGATLIFSDGAGSEQNVAWTTGWTTATGLPGGNILDIAFWGTHVLVLGSDNSIYGATIGTTAFTLLFNPAAVLTRIWVGLGRLFGSTGREIFEIGDLFGAPTETSVFSHPNQNMVFTSLIGTPVGIYFAGNIGQNAEVRYTKVATGGSGFDAPFVTAELLNEQIHVLAHAGNNIVIGSSAGIRYSAVDSQSPGLDYGPVVSAIGAVRDICVDNVGAETFAWFTWTDINGAGVSGLGRIRFARFAEPNVLAYASDIYTTGASTSLACASIGGRRYFAVSADGFYGATANFVASGTLSTGRIRYGILDTKVFSDLQWRTAPLPTDAQVSASMTFNTGQLVNTSAQTSSSSTESPVSNLGPAFAEWGEITFTLERGGVLTNALFVTNVSGVNATTPDDVSFAVTDLEVYAQVSLDSWVPGGFGATFVDQWPNSAGNNGWFFGLGATGFPTIAWSPDGTALQSLVSTVLPTLLPGEEPYFGVTFDVDNGAGGKTATFLMSDDGVSWDVLDTVTTAGTTTIHNSTATLGVNQLLPFNGYVKRAGLLDAIGGTEVANPNFNQAPGTTSFADAAGNTWTVNSTAVIALVPGTDASAPTMRAWVLRAIPSPQSITRFLVPIVLRRKLQVPHGPMRGVDAEAELEFLTSLVNSQAVVKYQEGRRAYDVHVVNFEAQGTDWDKTGHSMESLVLVEMHNLRG